jgi:hypothetical protein
MSILTVFVGFFGVPESRGEVRSPLCGPRMRPIFRRWQSRPHFRAFEPSSRPNLLQPSWVTTKETAAWRFGA